MFYVDIQNAKQDIAIADKATKEYVDGEIAKVHIDTTSLLPRNGSRKMTGDLKMDSNHILQIKNVDDHKDTDSLADQRKDLYSAVNKEYLNENFIKLKSNADGTEAFDLKQRKIQNCAPYSNNLFEKDDLVSRDYVDREIAKIPKVDTSDLVKLDGSRAMTGNLNMGDHTITGIRSSSLDNAALTVGGAKATYFPLSGNRSMQGNINIANHSIINLKDPQPSDSSYAASVNFVHKTINDSNSIISGIIDTKIKESEERAIESIDSSQRNECVNSSIGTKAPKIRHYGGSESSDFRTAAAISQFNEEYGYVNQAAQLMGVAGNAVTEKHTKVMDKKEDRNSLRQSTKAFKRARRSAKKKKTQKTRSLEHNKGVTYESGVGLTQSEADRLTITNSALSDLRLTITDKEFDDYVSVASLQESTKNEVLIAASPFIEFIHRYHQDFSKG